MYRTTAILAAAAMLTACASTATMKVAPAVTTFAANVNEVPGRWAVVVETGVIPTKYSSGEYTCSAWEYVVEAKGPFEESVVGSLDTAFQEVRPMPRLVTGDAARAEGLRGTIIVTVDRFLGDLTWRPGFWTASAVGQSTIRIGVEVRDVDGARLAGFSESAQRVSQPMPGACDIGSSAIAGAISLATQDLMEETVERLLDNPALRTGAATSPASAM
jgi:hypothetical protein